jgi:hypothetical protein
VTERTLSERVRAFDRDTQPPPPDDAAPSTELCSSARRDLLPVILAGIEGLRRDFDRHTAEDERRSQAQTELLQSVIEAMSGLGNLALQVQTLANEVSRLHADAETSQKLGRTTASKLIEHECRIEAAEDRMDRHSDRLRAFQASLADAGIHGRPPAGRRVRVVALLAIVLALASMTTWNSLRILDIDRGTECGPR